MLSQGCSTGCCISCLLLSQILYQEPSSLPRPKFWQPQNGSSCLPVHLSPGMEYFIISQIGWAKSHILKGERGLSCYEIKLPHSDMQTFYLCATFIWVNIEQVARNVNLLCNEANSYRTLPLWNIKCSGVGLKILRLVMVWGIILQQTWLLSWTHLCKCR